MLSLLLYVGCVNAVSAADAVTALELFFSHLTRLQADFEQVVRDADGNVLQTSSGTVVVQKPAHFRWDYTRPFQQLVLADGNRLWLYDPELRQVTVRSMQRAAGVNPAMLLSGDQPLGKSFHIRVLDKDNEGQWYELDPKDEQASFDAVRLALQNGQLHIMEFVDSFAQQTRLRFSHVRQNTAINPGTFEFQVPAGVDVVGDWAEDVFSKPAAPPR